MCVRLAATSALSVGTNSRYINAMRLIPQVISRPFARLWQRFLYNSDTTAVKRPPAFAPAERAHLGSTAMFESRVARRLALPVAVAAALGSLQGHAQDA